MKVLGFFIAIAALMFTLPADAASVTAKISLANQRMYVSVNGVPKYTWAVSTARSGYRTPTGTFRAQRLEAMWHSTKYDNAPMPHSVFFYGGYAIHGTNYVNSLGKPASHGCVRLHPDNARTLYNLVLAHGTAATSIVVVN